MSNLEDQENYRFEDNDKNALPIMSLNKKIIFGGFCVLILFMITFALLNGELILPGKRNNNIYFKGYALYALIFSGLIWVFHFAVQILANYTTDENSNNKFFKYAYNSKIFGIVFLILAFLLSFILYDSKGYTNFPDSKYKKEYIIFW